MIMLMVRLTITVGGIDCDTVFEPHDHNDRSKSTIDESDGQGIQATNGRLFLSLGHSSQNLPLYISVRHGLI